MRYVLYSFGQEAEDRDDRSNIEPQVRQREGVTQSLVRQRYLLAWIDWTNEQNPDRIFDVVYVTLQVG